MDTLNALNVLDKYGFEPQRVSMVLRKYHDFIARHFPQNTKKYMFFGRRNMLPTKYEGMMPTLLFDVCCNLFQAVHALSLALGCRFLVCAPPRPSRRSLATALGSRTHGSYG